MKKLTKLHLLYIFPLTLVISLVTGSLFYGVANILPKQIINKSYLITYLDSENKEIFSTHFESEGTYVPLEKISPLLIKGYILIEDKNFYKHNGLDVTRIVKSFISNTVHKTIVEGGSTITQQVARILYLNNEKTYKRKLKEAFIAARLEMHHTKKEILEYYLNSLYFGHGVYGVEDASLFYFGKHAYQLSTGEVAFLIGISNAPAYYSPLNNYDRSKQKQKNILYKLYKSGLISAQEYHNGYEENINIIGDKNEAKGLYYYYKQALVNQLKNLGLYTKENLVKGLNITTSFNYEISRKIYNILQYYKNDKNQVSVVVLEPNTSNVLSIFGGWDYEQSTYNRATSSSRQIASTIKPLIYYLALNSSFTPTTKLMSKPTTFFIKNYGEYTPSNNNDIYPNDEITMIQALGVSDNIYAIKTSLILGLNNVASFLNSFNIKNVDIVPSLALGSVSTTPLNLATIYNTFASEGYYTSPSFIKEVHDSYGNLLYKNDKKGYQKLNMDETIILNQLLRAPFDSKVKSYTSPTLLNYQTNKLYSAKTGTTESDSWTIGYNKKYTILVWVGTDDNSTLHNTSLSRKIFQDIANNIDLDTHQEWYEPTKNIEIKRVNPISGNYSSSGSLYYFAKA